VRLFYSFPNQHVDASPAVRVERERGSRQGYTITISFDGSDLFHAVQYSLHEMSIECSTVFPSNLYVPL
jgi:hypothetical protein